MYGVRRAACWWTSCTIIRGQVFDRQGEDVAKICVSCLNPST